MPTPEDVIKVAESSNKFLASSIENHQRRLMEAINQLEKNIIDMVKEFKTTNGTLLGPRVNMKQAQRVHAQLKKLFDETYGVEARAVSSGFDQAVKYIKNELGELDIAADFTSVDMDIINTLKKNTWGTFNQFGLAAQERMVDQMYSAILGKASFSSLVTNFQGILSGHKDARGRPMSMYANLYANDAIMNFHNSVSMKKAEDAGIDLFLYYGNLIATSRQFCIDRVKKVFSKEVIDSWDDVDWGGKSGPAYRDRGGYNCRHHWVPVRKSWLKEDVEVIEDVNWGKKKKKVVPDSKEFTISDKLKARIREEYGPHNLLIQPEWEAEFKRLGFSDEAIQEAKALLQGHGSVESIQKWSDAEILKHLSDPKSKVGDVIRASMAMEEKSYLEWKKGAAFRLERKRKELESSWDIFYKAEAKESGITTFEEFWESEKWKYEEKPIRVFRKGSLDSAIQSWTTDERGAWTGTGRITPDHMRTVDQLLEEGYKPLGGFSRMMGAPGEAEVTFVKPTTVGLAKPGVVAKTRETLKAEYEALKKKQYAVEPFTPKYFEFEEALAKKEIEIARTFTAEELLEAKTQILIDMTRTEGNVKITKAMRDKLQYTANWVPYDLLVDVRERGFKIVIKDTTKSLYRANYDEQFTAFLAKNEGREVFSHEFGHIIDAHFNASAQGGFYWENGKFVTKAEGVNLRKWFADHHPTNTKGVYTNGDGKFWKNNWITDYEGRIYTDHVGVGQEWWAMNLQRYAEYRNRYEFGYDRMIKNLTDNIKRYEAALVETKFPGTYTDLLKNEQARLKSVLERGREGYALSAGSEWNLAKQRYPKLTEFIETKFGKPFMLEEGEAVIAEAQAIAEKKVVKKVVTTELEVEKRAMVGAPLEEATAPKLFDVSKYADDYDKIKLTDAVRQAEWSDIQAQIKKDLDAIRSGEAKLKEVSGAITADAVDIMKSNMIKELKTFDTYLAGDTTNLMRDYIDELGKILKSDLKAFAGIEAAEMNDMFLDSVRKLVYQEVESNRMAFTDHGIRHIVKNILFQKNVMESLAKQGMTFSARERLLGQFIMVQHDVGYTVPLVRSGGLRGVKATANHPLFSTKIANQQKAKWNVGKIFTEDEYRRAMKIISTHDSTSLSMLDPLAFTTRVSDNLALFQAEKLPSFFRYIEGGEKKLVELGKAAKMGDEVAFKRVQKSLYTMIENSNLNIQLKRDLKHAINEMSKVTPKFTMGVLAGEITGVSATEASLLSVEMSFNRLDQLLQSMFDMGQKQARKFLGDYGITNYNKTRYLLGNYKGKPILEVVVKGVPAWSEESFANPLTKKQVEKAIASRNVIRNKIGALGDMNSILEAEATLPEALESIWVKDGIADVARAGRCYELACKNAMRNSGWDVAQGTLHPPLGPFQDMPYAHSWLERGNYVYDPVLNKFFDKTKYYQTFLVDEVNLYTSEQVLVKQLKWKHFGPWAEYEEMNAAGLTVKESIKAINANLSATEFLEEKAVLAEAKAAKKAEKLVGKVSKDLQEELITITQKEGSETVVILDSSGKKISKVVRANLDDPGAVGIPNVKGIDDGSSKFSLVHTHTLNEPLSYQDIKSLAQYEGINSVSVCTPDGMVYTAIKKTDRSTLMRKLDEKFLVEKTKILDDFTAGKITKAEAKRRQIDAANKILVELDKEGYIALLETKAEKELAEKVVKVPKPDKITVDAVKEWVGVKDSKLDFQDFRTGSSEKAEALRAAIKNAPPVGGKVYRGMGVTEEFVEGLKPGSLIDLNKVASFSETEGIAAGFAKTAQEAAKSFGLPSIEAVIIEVDGLSNGLRISNLAESLAGQREILSSGSLRIKSIKKVGNVYRVEATHITEAAAAKAEKELAKKVVAKAPILPQGVVAEKVVTTAFNDYVAMGGTTYDKIPLDFVEKIGSEKIAKSQLMEAKLCYSNSLLKAQKEGYELWVGQFIDEKVAGRLLSTDPKYVNFSYHAWNVKDGKILDYTLGKTKGAYIGKRISIEGLKNGAEVRDKLFAILEQAKTRATKVVATEATRQSHIQFAEMNMEKGWMEKSGIEGMFKSEGWSKEYVDDVLKTAEANLADFETRYLAEEPTRLGSFQKSIDKWTKAVDNEGRLEAAITFTDNPKLQNYLHAELLESMKGKVGWNYKSLREFRESEITVWRVGPIRDGFNSFFLNEGSATSYAKRMGVDTPRRYKILGKDIIPTQAGSGELFASSEHVIEVWKK